MDTTNEYVQKIAELSVVNSKEIEKLKNKDEDIITSVGTLNDLTNIIISYSKSVENKIIDIQKQSDALKIELDEFKLKQENDKKVAINSLRKKAELCDYITQSEFGRNFIVAIGSKSVGKLLRLVSIAYKEKSVCIPYQRSMPRYADNYIFVDNGGFERISYKWNYKNCLEKIELWMESHQLLERFYSISTEVQMTKFINELYSTYIGN